MKSKKTDNSRQEADTVLRDSEFLKASNDFARYAYKEWVEDCEDERAMMVCCVDRTTPGGTGAMNVVGGNRTLVTAAVMRMMEDDGLKDVFRDARLASVSADDLSEGIAEIRGRLRALYWLSALTAGWTLCVAAFQVAGIANWITTASCLLMILYLAFSLRREIRMRRRLLKRMEQAERLDRRDRLEHKARALVDALKERLCQDDDDDE